MTLTQMQRAASGDGVCNSFAGKEGISGDPLAGTPFSPGCGREAWGAHGKIRAGCRAGGGLEEGIIGPFVTLHTVTSLGQCPFPCTPPRRLVPWAALPFLRLSLGGLEL